MSIRTTIKRRIMSYMFSPKRRDARRRKAEQMRLAQGIPHSVLYFHDMTDPYSHLMLQLLPAFTERYDIQLEIHMVPPPPDWAAEERTKLEAYARQDGQRLATKTGLDFSDPGCQPDPDCVAAAITRLSDAQDATAFLSLASDLSTQLWAGKPVHAEGYQQSTGETCLAAGNAKRDALGHYLGATVFYGGEWYWGPDRLHYLEARLTELGARRDDTGALPLLPPPGIRMHPPSGAPPEPVELHWYLSFRSPYTAIVAERIKRLAEAYGAELKLRFVLPMVMRGLQVPQMKGVYILKDVVREAERLNVPFGNICDPVGKPVERGYALLHSAIEAGRGYEFVQSFLSGVWAEGLDAGSDRGLKRITQRAGLNWTEMKKALTKEDWRAEAEANRQEMLALGLWGVPSFRVGNVSSWGQDRLWVIEDALQDACRRSSD